MKLAAKLVLLFLVCLAMVVSVFSYLSQQQIRRLALAEHERHASDLAASFQMAIGSSKHGNLDQVLIAFSRGVQNVRVRLVNPYRDFDEGQRPSVPAELVIRTTKTTTFLMPDRSGQNKVFTYVPLDRESGNCLEVATSDAFWSERLSESLRSSAIALVSVSLVTSLVILMGGLWMVGKPLDQLVEKVQRIGQGDLTGPVELQRSDELGRLGEAVNDMCFQLDRQREQLAFESEQRLAAVDQLRHADRLRTVGRLAAGLAHEIGTPLNVVSGRAELIAGGKLSADEVLASARTIKAQSQRIATIVQELLNFARRKAPHRQVVPLNQLVTETVALIRPMAAKRQAQIEFAAVETRALANIDAAQVQQVITNLLVNALQATDAKSKNNGFNQVANSEKLMSAAGLSDGNGKSSRASSDTDFIGVVQVSISRCQDVQAPEDLQAESIERLAHGTSHSLASNSKTANVSVSSKSPGQADVYWRIRVADNGCGMEPEVVESVFEPFFTTKDVGEGTGLGLSIAYGIVREHGGWIDVHSHLGQGSSFDVYLPAAE